MEFDDIERILELMRQHELLEFEMEQDGLKLRVRKTGAGFMSRDQLLPPGVSKVHPKFRTPYITTMITGVVVAIVAGLTPINILGEMTSIGTLFAFVVVSMAVIILRRRRPDARRPFRVPGGYVIPVLGVVSCAYLMISLTVMTWVRFLVWLDLGMVIYWFYGRTHSQLANRAEAAARSSMTFSTCISRRPSLPAGCRDAN